jgi:nicotinamidase-related amidase
MLTKIDPHCALIVIDLQNGIVGLPTVHPIEGVVKCAVSLADAFRRNRLPVVLVNVAGGAPGRVEQSRGRSAYPPGWMTLLPEIGPQPTDHTVTKRTWGAFTDTGLDRHLGGFQITQVVLAGVSTSAGVESTARQAHELGYNVTLAVDAMTDMSNDAHLNSVTRIFPKLGETGSTAQIIELLGR